MKTMLPVLCVCVTALGCARAQAPATAPAPQTVASGFLVGDRILLQVEGDSALTKAFAVDVGPALTLPVIGPIPLTGVRRSDIEPYLSQQLARYLKDPVVHAKALIKLSIVGEVEHPGFYAVPADILLADALMQAGGPTRDAKVAAMHIERGGKALLAGDSLQAVLAHGVTVDQAGLCDGDRLVVPRLVHHDPESTWRILGILVTIPAAIYGISRTF
jgi:polysaccharide biosynthesis/export protein